jgi:hypothetical protein
MVTVLRVARRSSFKKGGRSSPRVSGQRDFRQQQSRSRLVGTNSWVGACNGTGTALYRKFLRRGCVVRWRDTKVWRKKVDGSQTSFPGRESNCELSARSARRPVLGFWPSEKFRDLYLSKLEERFSATGRRGRFAENPAKPDDFSALTNHRVATEGHAQDYLLEGDFTTATRAVVGLPRLGPAE